MITSDELEVCLAEEELYNFGETPLENARDDGMTVGVRFLREVKQQRYPRVFIDGFRQVLTRIEQSLNGERE